MLVQRPLRGSRKAASAVLAVMMSTLVACGSDDDTADSIDSRSDDAATTTIEGDDPAGTEAPDGDAGQADDGEGPVVITSDDEHDCSGEDVSIDGVDLDVELRGSCGDVVVSGQGNSVGVDDATSVTLRGVGHDVDVEGAADALALEGEGHHLSYTGDPTVTDRSVGSSVDPD